MEPVTALFESDQWLWIAEHPAVLLFIVIASAVPAATATWLGLKLRYRSTIEKQQRTLEAFASNLGGATPDEALRRIQSLQARLDRLEPRHLSSRQKTVLGKCLPLPEGAGMTHINVAYDASCGDGKQYATEFARVLRASAGWQASSGTVFGWGRRTGSGLAIVCFKHGRTAAAAKVLSNALIEAGIEHETVYSPEEELELVITSRNSAAAQPPDD